MKLFLAVCWSIIMIEHITECAAGIPPSWFDVFCPLIVVFINCWCDWIVERLQKNNKSKSSLD